MKYASSTLEKELTSIKRCQDLSPENRDHILEMVRNMRAENLSVPRIARYLQSFRILAPAIDFDLGDPSGDDVRDLIIRINEREIGNAESVWTDKEYRQAVKKFYSYREYDASWIRTHPPKHLKPTTHLRELPKPRHIQSLIAACESPRDRAYIFFLWATGARISEVLDAQWSDVFLSRDSSEFIIRNGKTGARSVPFTLDPKHLQALKTEDSEGYLWMNQYGDRLGYNGARDIVRRAAKKAGIPEHIKLNPHAFRKGRATQLSFIRSVWEMCDAFGWDDPGTSMTYVRIGRGARDEMLRPHDPVVVPRETFRSEQDAAQTTLVFA